MVCSGSKPKKTDQEKNAEFEFTKPKSEAKTTPSLTKNRQTPSEKKMIYFEDGTFLMDSETGLLNEKPVHEVKIEPFYIDKTPAIKKE